MEKSAIRTMIRSQGPMDPMVGSRVAEGLFVWLSGRLPGTVASFLAMPGEVDTSQLFRRLPGWRWVLPRVEPSTSVSFRDRDVSRETHRFGMEQPVDEGPIIQVHEIDIFLAPGLAFDRSGGRIGNGRGFYDRILTSKRSDAQVVGITVEKRVLDSIPMGDHDCFVGWLATELGVTACSPRM